VNVAVVIGDVRKPDPVEPSATFGEIEGDLIDLLKLALDSLPEYQFTFLDNHDTLLQDLQAPGAGAPHPEPGRRRIQ
jgi:D-alanine-D-alanine ligase